MTLSPAGCLSEAERAVFARLGCEVAFTAGERVLAEGAAGDGFYVVVSGSIDVRKAGRSIAVLGEGAVLGEMAVFGENVRTAEACAITASRLLFVTTDELVGLVLRGEHAAVEAMQMPRQLMVGPPAGARRGARPPRRRRRPIRSRRRLSAVLGLGVRRERLVLTDVNGVVYRGRGDGNYLEELAAETGARTLADAVASADVFVGVSAPNVLTPEMLRAMAADPIVFALVNPLPEIDHRLARQARGDVILATGRSDYPNQINNVIAFPHLFRGALDVRSRAIDESMKLAVTHAIAALAREQDGFARGALIPKPFDRRLLPRVATAVAGGHGDGHGARDDRPR
jgi:Cyclic nucleotide-binding domain/Malic enzyme, NAD binding domain